MKSLKYTGLAVAVVSTMHLTQCQSLPTDINALTDLPKNTEHRYPETRTQAVKQDRFLSGEMGRPSELVGENVDNRAPVLANERAKPATGVERHFAEKVVDKYQWLENIDVISPEYMQETTADRQRNFIGTRSESDRPNGQLDNRTTQSLQAVNKFAAKSEVTEWVDAQNYATKTYLNNLPIFEQVQANAKSLFDWEFSIRKVKTDKGELHFYRGNDGYKRVVRTDKDGKTHEMWRETDLDWGIRDSKNDFYPSPDGSYFGMVLSTGSTTDTDKLTVVVYDSLTGKEVFNKYVGKGEPRGAHALVWLDDDSFIYGEMDDMRGAMLYQHDIGVKRINDPLVVESAHIGGLITIPWLEGKDKRYLVYGTTIKGLDDTFVMQDRQTGKFYRPYDKKLIDKRREYAEFFIGAKFVSFNDKTGDLWLISGENDDQRGEIIKTNIHNLKKREVVVPVNINYDRIMEAVYHAEDDGYFVIKYLKDGQHKIILTDNKGTPLKDLTPAPTGSSDSLVSFVVGAEQSGNSANVNADDKKDENYVSFRYQNAGLPRTVYKYSIKKETFLDVRRRDLYPFPHEDYTSELVKYKSKDGTEIPMSITYKKGMVKNGKNPTLMMAYGGFGVLIDVVFSPQMAMFLENGGIFAQPAIRGGNEYGENWHSQGTQKSKINVFDDFESAADYLHEQGYTSPAYTAINGGSNGGLLVAAAMTLAPGKYAAAIPHAGVLDMFAADKKYYLGQWNAEYGSVHDSQEMYNILKAYSPYHNVKAGVCYPATLVSTAKRDDRVLPFHSYKFAAALQENQGCDKPTYLYAHESYGHGAKEALHRIEYGAMINAFALHEMGIRSVAPAKRPTVEQLKGEKWLKEEAEQKAK